MTGYQTYQRTSVQTSDRVEVIILLYDRAISNLNQAAMHFDGELEECDLSKRLTNTHDIVNFLRGTLDFEQGGEIAVNLANLYDYIRDIVNEGAIHRNAEKMREARNLLAEVLEGWRGIAKESPGSKVGEQTVLLQNAAGTREPPATTQQQQKMAMTA